MPKSSSSVRDAHDASLLEQRRRGDVRARERARVGARRAHPRRRPPALERDDRLDPRDAPSDLQESTRVAEALHVQEDDARGLVMLPVLEQIVRRHVGLVPDADEVTHPDAERARVVEDGEPERARLRAERDVARRRPRARERRVEPNVVVRAERAETVRADHPHAERAYAIAELVLRGDARRAELGVAGRDHDHAAHAFLSAIVDHAHHVRARHRDDCEVHVTRDRRDTRVREDRLDVARARIDGKNRPAKLRGDEVAKDLPADALAIA